MADILKAEVKARLRLVRNGVTLHDQTFDSGQDDYIESSQQRVVLPAAMGVATKVNLDGVSAAKKVLILTDREIKVALNNITYLVPVATVLSVTSTAGITGIWLKNEDANFTATVSVAVSD